jgi:hypothetical protein
VRGVRPGATSKAAKAAKAAKAEAAALASSASVVAPLRGELENALNAAVKYQYAPVGNLSTLQRIGTSVFLSLASCDAQPTAYLSRLQRQSEMVFRGQLQAAAALPLCCQQLRITPHELHAAAHDMARMVCLLSKPEEIQNVMATRPHVDLVARTLLCAEMSQADPAIIGQLVRINQNMMIKEAIKRAESEYATISFLFSYLRALYGELEELFGLWEERKGVIFVTETGRSRVFNDTARFRDNLSKIHETMAVIAQRLEEAGGVLGAYRAATRTEPNQVPVEKVKKNIHRITQSTALLRALLRREIPYTEVNNMRRITQTENGVITIPDKLGAMPGLPPFHSVIAIPKSELPALLVAQFVNINTNLFAVSTIFEAAFTNRPHMMAAQSVCSALGAVNDPTASFEAIRRFIDPDRITVGSKCAFVYQNRGEALCVTTPEFARFRVMELCGTMALGEAALSGAALSRAALSGAALEELEPPEARGEGLDSTQEALRELRSCRNPIAVSPEYTQHTSSKYPWPQHRINLETGSHLTPAKKVIGLSPSLTNTDRLGVVKIEQINGVMIFGGLDFPGVGPCDMKISLHLTNMGQNTDLRPGSAGSFHIELTQLVEDAEISTTIRLLPAVRDGFLFYKGGKILQKHSSDRVTYTSTEISDEMMTMIQTIIASLNANPIPLFAISLTTEDLTERIQRRLLENNAVRALTPLTRMGQLNAVNDLNDLPPLPQELPQELPRQRHYSERNHDYVYESGNAIVIGDRVTIPRGSSVPGEDPRIRSGVVVMILDQEMVVVEFGGIRIRCFTRDLVHVSKGGDASVCSTNTPLSRKGRRTRRAHKKTRRTRRSNRIRRSNRTRRTRQ